ncbi:Ribosomal protein L23 [Melioribacter roseus P3M-2]|jgi:large subunit ribosomal protein L23|uniref:Large ribosomal subunit protein uL23 n=1 Tax=Melioribacter roseus (strain DSM 23840 / JCM 17771 / VKM B-2668 / P3M-2) TaxID=1191523 RepID=I6ZWM2_MELRP|nr:50S ribosomal protein L23 [Melioribacter roseus]AFN73458.1 Ribosomal protein L23 [Melioribacter roseus P3M-2]
MKSILIRPLITEKMTSIQEKHPNKYGFIVSVDANKIEIAKAVKEKFNVDVVAVNTMRYKGKRRTQFTRRGRFEGRTPKFKKAVVTLKEGQTIDIFGEV